MHSIYEGIHGPYCLQRNDGSFIDAAVLRGTAAMANHGILQAPVGTRANAIFKENRETADVWIEAIHPILNGDQVIVHYSDHHPILWLPSHGYVHWTR